MEKKKEPKKKEKKTPKKEEKTETQLARELGITKPQAGIPDLQAIKDVFGLTPDQLDHDSDLPVFTKGSDKRKSGGRTSTESDT